MPLPSNDYYYPKALAGSPQYYAHYNDKPDQHGNMLLLEDRASGELEGSTLGSSSRDSDRGSRDQRRTAASSGFLLDSSFMPRSKGLRTIYRRPSRRNLDHGGRNDIPASNILPKEKEKSLFPWTRPKRSAGSLSFGATSQEPTEAQQETVLGPGQEPEGHGMRSATAGTAQALDGDSAHIVNLALSLSESRRRANTVRPPSRRLSATTKPPSYGDIHVSAPTGSAGHQVLKPRRLSALSFADGNAVTAGLQQQAAREQLILSDSVLESDYEPVAPFTPSDNTLARAENARRHFELFTEYLRLLSFLPPLSNREASSGTEYTLHINDSNYFHRAYNPLQSIRNRKIRFREKCVIDIKAEGWNNTEYVRQWVDNIEEQFSRQSHDYLVCLELPSLRKETRDRLEEPDNSSLSAVSPSSSIRQVRRVGSVKIPRPRHDWLISPAELLSDAAWVEDKRNKAKIIDRDGRHVFSDPLKLVTADTQRPQKQPHLHRGMTADRRIFDTPASEPRHAVDAVSEGPSRGRQRHRIPSPPYDSSVSTRDGSSKQDETQLRSGSSSAAPSMEGGAQIAGADSRAGHGNFPELRPSTFLNSYLPRVNGQDKREDTDVSSSPNIRLSRYLSGKGVGRTTVHEAKGSLSSTASIDELYSPRISLDVADSPATSPYNTGYFPSITVNLSPPSSRSPSPSKRHFSRTKAVRHERGKSKGKKDFRDRRDSSPLYSEPREKHSSQELVTLDRPDKVELSPASDHIAASYQRDQLQGESEGLYSASRRKGPSPQDSKLRGFFKGSSKIAGLVGSEVYKVGDRMLRKDSPAHSRMPSTAASVASGDSDTDNVEEMRDESRSVPKASLHHLPVFSDERSGLGEEYVESGAARTDTPALLTLASSHRQAGEDNLYGQAKPTRARSIRALQTKINDVPSTERCGLDGLSSRDPSQKIAISRFPSPSRGKMKGGRIGGSSAMLDFPEPLAAGLVEVKASTDYSPREGCKTLLETPRSWSISGSSSSPIIEVGTPINQEIERTRALLLSSGIKAQEIVRRAKMDCNPLSELLRSSADSSELASRAAGLHEFDIAAQRLLQGFEKSQHLLQRSIDNFSVSTSSRLRSQLSRLETLANQTLSPRVRMVSDNAEDLGVQLHTTSTLAVKQLSDALDRGMRKRHRRLRWIRRAGFRALEWALVAVLWWVWLIVMIFKLFRGTLRGTVSGARWILWI